MSQRQSNTTTGKPTVTSKLPTHQAIGIPNMNNNSIGTSTSTTMMNDKEVLKQAQALYLDGNAAFRNKDFMKAKENYVDALIVLEHQPENVRNDNKNEIKQKVFQHKSISAATLTNLGML